MDVVVAVHADVGGGEGSGFTFFDADVAVLTGDFVLAGVELMGEGDGLDGLIAFM